MPPIPQPPVPSSDKRWKLVTTVLRRQGKAPHALIEGMHAVQEAFGHIDPASLRFLAETLGVPLAKAYGVATFYHHFVLEPPGEHTCVVCLGTACHLKGGPEILRAIERAHHLKPGETSPGGEVSLLVARCLGVCSLAPAVVLEGDMIGPCSPEQVLARVAPWLEGPEGSPR